MPNTLPHSNVNLQEVSTRHDTARRIIAGFAKAMPALADIWLFLGSALDDAPSLAAEITRLSAELANTRLDRANLAAAARATIAAAAEGEADPLWYLRDELAAHHAPPGAPEMPSAPPRGQR
jgi:hypothetical protein